MTTDQKRQMLVDAYNLNRNYVQYVPDNYLDYEIECCEIAKKGGNPAHLLADISPGRQIDETGKITVLETVELIEAYGFETRKILALDKWELHELWAATTKTSLTEDYLKRKERSIKAKERAVKKNKILKLEIKKFNA